MKKYFSAFIGLLLSGFTNGQTTEAKNGIENNYKNLNNKQIQLLFNAAKSFPNNTQLSIALIRNKKIDFIGVERLNDTIKPVENQKYTFEIGSITKVFTATLLADFVEKQKLNLDDYIQDYLDFKINTESKITFKQLANHTSGLPRLPSNLNLWLVDQDNPYKDYNKEKLITYLTKEIKLNQEPGTKYEYSNLGAGILGFELATIANSSFESLLQDKIFTKYNMLNSSSKSENIKTKLVKGLNPKGKNTPNWDFNVLTGAGAVFSTAEDLAQFVLAQFNYQNNALMLTQKPTFKINKAMSIGLGWHILKSEDSSELIWHNGGTGGYTSSMAVNVKKKNGIIILSNVSALNKKIANIDQLCIDFMKTLEEEDKK